MHMQDKDIIKNEGIHIKKRCYKSFLQPCTIVI